MPKAMPCSNANPSSSIDLCALAAPTADLSPRLRLVPPSSAVPRHGLTARSDFHERVSTLMSRYAAGDERAFTALYALMRPRLARLCGSMVGPLDESDVLQQVFLKLHRARASFVPGGNAVAWSYAVARRVCIDHLRTPARALELAMDHEQLDTLCPGTEADEPSLRALLNDRLRQLSACVRSTYVLVKVEGLSCAETASVLGTSVSAVKQRVHRATAELRAELSSETSRCAANA